MRLSLWKLSCRPSGEREAAYIQGLVSYNRRNGFVSSPSCLVENEITDDRVGGKHSLHNIQCDNKGILIVTTTCLSCLQIKC